MIYSIARCPNCNILQTIQFQKILTAVFRCRRCNKQTKIHKTDGTRVELHGLFDHPSTASAVCIKLKESAEEFKYANSL